MPGLGEPELLVVLVGTVAGVMLSLSWGHIDVARLRP